VVTLILIDSVLKTKWAAFGTNSIYLFANTTFPINHKTDLICLFSRTVLDFWPWFQKVLILALASKAQTPLASALASSCIGLDVVDNFLSL